MKITERRRAIKREAVRIIMGDAGGFIASGVLMLVVLTGVAALFDAFAVSAEAIFSAETYIAILTVLRILYFVILAPYVVGMIVCYSDIACCGKVAVHSVFEYYASYSKIVRAVKIMAIPVMAFLIISALPQIVSYCLLYLFDIAVSSQMTYRFVAGSFLLLYTFFSSILLCGLSCFICTAEKCREYSLRRAVAVSFGCMRRHKFECLVFELSFLPLFILSYLTFGVLYVIVVPYYLLSHGIFSAYVAADSKKPLFYAFA